MALNFPSDTSQPFVDPTSGIKYIYNPGIGAWESAIQPPAIVSGSQPDIAIEGFMWWDDVNSELYVYNTGSWIAVAPNVSTQVHASDTPPASPGQGSLWWDTESGQLYIYYVDVDSNQWVVASPLAPAVGGNVVVSDTAPDSSVSVEGDLWFNTNTEAMYVFNESNVWQIIGNAVAGVASVTAGTNVNLTGPGTDPIINVPNASTGTAGVIEIATQSEVNATTDSTRAIVPSTLAAGIFNYVPDATTSQKGVMETATDAETLAGTATDKAVTPASLDYALPLYGVGNPPGTIIAFAGSTVPSGYFECNGQAGDRVTYANLFAVCGTVYGAGNNTTTFNVPDLRGEFLRGWDNGRGLDSGRAIGSEQTSSNKSHTHGVNDPGHVHSTTFTDDTTDRQTGAAQTGNVPTSGFTASATTGISLNNQGGTESRPHNVAIMYCIKF